MIVLQIYQKDMFRSNQDKETKRLHLQIPRQNFKQAKVVRKLRTRRGWQRDSDKPVQLLMRVKD